MSGCGSEDGTVQRLLRTELAMTALWVGRWVLCYAVWPLRVVRRCWCQ